jgi:hypothetical protein
MKMKFGAIVVDGRGKIGGHVASKNRGGAYLRTKVTPTNPQSSSQAAVRNRLTTLAQGFKTLTANQISAWNAAVSDFAKTDIFGDIKQPSGINLYSKLNSNLGEVGVPFISNPPLPAAVGVLTNMSVLVDATNNSIEVSFDEAVVPTGNYLIIRATAPASAGVSNFSGKYRNVYVSTLSEPLPKEIDLEYLSKFGSYQVGQKIGFEAVLVNAVTGQKGTAISASSVAI